MQDWKGGNSMKLSDIVAAIFPLRTVLLSEIEYLKSQLAQERRRVDVLQEGLIQAKRPTVLMTKPAQVNPTTKPRPVGWEATRAEIRNERIEEVSARSDAGSEGTDADQRIGA
jgi:hypothetical protein